MSLAPAPLTADNVVDFIGEVFQRRAADGYLGEPVTTAEHMLQSAQHAELAGADDEVVAAALLHDLGHYTHEFPEDAALQGIDSRHQEAGARLLASYFPPLVTDCVRLHVDAKRYLCATEPAYFDGLSPASVHSLQLQGGPMNPTEVDAFAAQPNLTAILQVRRWDDLAKTPGVSTPSFDHYVPLLRRVVARVCSGHV